MSVVYKIQTKSIPNAKNTHMHISDKIKAQEEKKKTTNRTNLLKLVVEKKYSYFTCRKENKNQHTNQFLRI